ncbi:zymogen granule membrane glycoprotein [Pelomyxa schiedti]|nr:zymogen granule membrane glycoprotein [Pelomyxa schiedti]
MGTCMTNVMTILIEGVLTPMTKFDDDTKVKIQPWPGVGKNLLIQITTVLGTAHDQIFSYNPPVVLSSTQASTVGGDITIYGYNFGPLATVAQAYIRGATCSSASVSTAHTGVTCRVSPGVGQSLNATVCVGSQCGSAAVFKYAAPTITSVSTANTDGSTLVTIQGTNFGPNGTAATVKISNRSCTGVYVSSHTKITCKPPVGTGANLVLKVTVGAQTVQSSFSYSAPTITSVSPANTNGAERTFIVGTNFGPNSSFVAVNISGVQCNGLTVNHTTISCVPTAGTGKNNPVVVRINGQSATSTFTYRAPVVNSATSTNTTGGTTTITGSNFGNLSPKIKVKIGGTVCSSCVIASAHTQIQCTSPVGTGQNTTVEVNCSSLVGSKSVFSYLPPTISSASPTHTDRSSKTFISGTNFGITAGGIAVTINGKSCTDLAIVTQHVTISCLPPVGVGNSLPVSVTVSQQTVLKSVFSYTAPSITNAAASFNGSYYNIILNGDNFGSADSVANVSVRIGSASCSQARITVPHQQIQCTLLGGNASAVSLSLFPFGSGSPGTAYCSSCLKFDGPVLYSASSVPTDGHTPTIIAGLRLGLSPTVWINGKQCENVSSNANQTSLTCYPAVGVGKGLPVLVSSTVNVTAPIFSYEGMFFLCSNNHPNNLHSTLCYCW